MGNIKEQMKKVRAASLGEVILFAGPDMFHTRTYQYEDVVFKGGLSIYKGISDVQKTEDDDGNYVYSTLVKSHNIELALLKQAEPKAVANDPPVIVASELFFPIAIPSGVENQMTLGKRDKAYVGADAIADVLKREAKGLFDNFFQQYIRNVHRT